MEIHGYCDERFAAVRDEFTKNFNERGDVGASFAVSIEGEMVIDLWAGHRNADKTLPWQQDTIANVYSTTKTMTFLSALMLADRGLLDFNAPVASYWPEFAANGKAGVTVANLLSHSAGIPAFDPVLTAEQLYDWDIATANLAAQKPCWQPGSQSGYHAITQGFLIGEVVRRITGKSFGTFFRENVAQPLDADFTVGLKVDEFSRVADLIADPKAGASPIQQMPADSMTSKVFNSTKLPDNAGNSEGWRCAEIPAANGHGNARSVVRAQTALANNGKAFGVELLTPQGCAKAREVQITSTDLVLMFPIKFAMGYAFGNKLLPISPNENAIWWAGAGGSTIVIDEDNRTCFSYVMNQMKAAMVGDERSGSLSKALYAAL